MARLNALPTIDARRKRLHMPTPAKVPNPFKPVARMKPTVRHVTEIVPPEHHPEVEAPAGWIIAPTGLSVDMKAHPFPVGT